MNDCSLEEEPQRKITVSLNSGQSQELVAGNVSIVTSQNILKDSAKNGKRNLQNRNLMEECNCGEFKRRV